MGSGVFFCRSENVILTVMHPRVDRKRLPTPSFWLLLYGLLWFRGPLLDRGLGVHVKHYLILGKRAQ